MTSQWQRPDYRVGKNNYSTYNLLQHNSGTDLQEDNNNSGNSNMYYKTKMAGDGYDDAMRNMAADPLPVHTDRHRDGSPFDEEFVKQPQTFRDDPRYGSARRQYGNQTNRHLPGGMSDPRTGNNAHLSGSFGSKLKHGGALLFIRFPTGSGPGRTDNVGVASQAFLRSKTFDMGGKFLGIAKTVYDFGYNNSQRDALGLYHFPTQEKAKLFFQYDMTIRQPDFPPPYGHAEIWSVSNAYLPDNLEEYNTFLLSEVMLHHGRDKREFFEVFQKPFESYLSSHGVMPFVVCSYGSYDRECLRRHAYPHQAIITCHLFKGINHLKWLTDQETYMKFRSLHNQMADERCTVFTIQRDLCP